ncbi:hypothetical protein P3L10_030180 [Capsicum annuum]
MPVNTSLPLSTSEVKPYLQDIETSKFSNQISIEELLSVKGVVVAVEFLPHSVKEGSKGKEQGKGITSSTMLSGQVIGTTMDKNSVFCENEYMQDDTPFYSSTNQVKQQTKEAEANKFFSIAIGKGPDGEDVRMRTIRKNSLVLEKAYKQVDTTFSPSTNQVKQRTKEAEIRVFKNSDKFESDDMTDHRDHIFGWMNELWNKWRGHLHSKYVKNNPMVHALKCKPERVEKKDWEWLVKEYFCSKSFQARSKRNTTNRANLTMLHHIGSKPIREIMYQQGGKDGNPPDLGTIFYVTHKKGNKLVEHEEIEKHAQIEEIVKAEPSLPTIEIVEKCWGHQNHSYVVCFGSGVKAKDMKGSTSSKTELLSTLRSTREDNKSLIEENKSLNDHFSTLEDEMEKIRKMQEFFAPQQSHIPHTTPPVSIE